MVGAHLIKCPASLLEPQPVLLTLRICALREEKVGLGMPNPIHDWACGLEERQQFTSDAPVQGASGSQDGNMSSPAFSSLLVAAPGRDVSSRFPVFDHPRLCRNPRSEDDDDVAGPRFLL